MNNKINNKMVNKKRREYLRKTLIATAAALSGGYFFYKKRSDLISGPSSSKGASVSSTSGEPFEADSLGAHRKANAGGKEAMYYVTLERNRVRCELCYRTCNIRDGRRGFCRNRENRGGKLYNVVYGRPSAIHVDPIEKEPQHHMLPGTQILCYGTAGCNFRCRHCQNWHLSQQTIEEIGDYYDHPPEEVVENAKEKGVPTISATYNEPTSFYEYLLDYAKLAKKEGLRILWHTNAYLKPDPLRELLLHTDAVTIDLKGFSSRAYENSEAELEPVLENLKIMKEAGVWIEIVNLVIPTINDSMEEIRDMSVWVRDELSPEVPLHFSRFFPAYKLTNVSATPVDTLEKAYETAREVGIHYVTIGNVPGHTHNSTFCPQCNNIIIRRTHFQVADINVSNGKCNSCGHKIPGIWA